MDACLLLLCLFHFFSTKPRDWLGRTSPKWPILCRVGRKTLTQSSPTFIVHVKEGQFDSNWANCCLNCCRCRWRLGRVVYVVVTAAMWSWVGRCCVGPPFTSTTFVFPLLTCQCAHRHCRLGGWGPQKAKVGWSLPKGNLGPNLQNILG